jgi:hypothetical protein
MKGPFQPAKDPMEVAAAGEVDVVQQGPKPTPVPNERLKHLLDPSGESQRHVHHDYGGMDVDEATVRRAEQIISLDHKSNSIQRVSDNK